ncbi:MAG: hypothetical protein H0V17_16615 [Deltaproteobacteria bacterium]|nr:hypothetical protein [Deltaproteobacteria bacterium]
MTRWLVLMVSCLGIRTAHADDPAYLCKQAPPDMKLTASFSPQVSLQDLATWVLGFSCKNIVIANDVAKHATKMTIMAPKQMTPKQAMQLFVDAVEANGLVVVQKPDSILIKLGPNMPKNCPDLTAAPRQPKTSGVIPLGGGTPTPTPAVDMSDEDYAKAMAAGIKRLDGTHVEITRATVDLLLANPMEATKGARVVPAMTGGKVDGLKMYGIRPGSLWAMLGFANGDTVKTVNGLRIDNAETGLDVYQKLRSEKRFEVALVRGGKPVVLVLTVK